MTSSKRQVSIFESGESEAAVHAYCCLRCGGNVLMLNGLLGSCGRRVTDGAYAVLEERIQRVDVSKGDVKDLLRPGKGAERQHRMNCAHCGVLVGYKARDIDDVRNKYSYILPGILSANPTITLQSLEAKELAVPASINEEKIEGVMMTTVVIRVYYGSHTKIQVSDVTSDAVILQLRDTFKDNSVTTNEALLHFFARMLATPKPTVQLLTPPPSSPSNEKLIGLQKASCGFVFASLLKAMMEMKYFLPKTYDAREEAVKEEMRKRKRAEEE
eukprot:TRINITY_DN24906_c0_g1_i1.p1 TRINITY_DN24906_c0_g1~~TRINITY_DN24906_c0_g1_i1.p1  ORF type:complete len:279 (+),score=71.79 TRINITY_DN24906_c0_g1_i1:22-837(+)